MNRREIRERVEEALQDAENRRWTNAEINRYIDDAQREFVRISRQPQVTATVPLSAGAATPVAASAVVDGKTVTVTTTTAHGLSTGDTVVVSNQAYVITVLTETIFRYLSEQTQTGGITYRPVDPTLAVPSSIEEIVSASIDGINLAIMSEGELDAAVFRYSSGADFLNGVFGVVPNPFTTIRANYTVNATPKWRERNGPVEAIVFNHASADTFRVFPLPSRDEDLFIDSSASNKVYKEISLRGLPKILDMTSDTAEPIIGHFYHEALVFGALERAYNREGQTRNTEKSQVARARFMELATGAMLNEGINSFSRSEGRNESYFRVTR